MVQAYCFKDKKKVDVLNEKYELNKINRPVVSGKCAICGGKVYKILSRAETPANLLEKLSKKTPLPRKSKKKGDSSSRTSRRKKSLKN